MAESLALGFVWVLVQEMLPVPWGRSSRRSLLTPSLPAAVWAAHRPVGQRDAAMAVGTGEWGSSLPSIPLEWSCGPELRPLELCGSGDTESSLDDLLETAGTEHCPLVVLHPRAPPDLHGVVMGSQQRGCDGGAGMGPACLAQSL